MTVDIGELISRIGAHATPERKNWWTRYLKGAAEFRGVAMADVRREVRRWYHERDLAATDPELRADLALSLLRKSHTEDKLAGMILLQERLLPEGAPGFDRLVPAFASLFEDGHLADWNAVDWFCVKVLGPLSARDGEPCARAIGDWRSASGLWRCRASAVAFVNRVRDPEPFEGFHDLVLASCRILVGRPERFAQTGAGWVLRELSVRAPGRVDRFVREHGSSMSREALRSAVRRLG